MPGVRALDLADLKEIYGRYMEDDFPIGELRPFSSIKKNYEQGNYNGFGFYEGERLLAYACFYSYRGSSDSLMDYFAVVPELRGRGVGSAFLKAMEAELPKESLIFIEAESPDSAKDEADRLERERRIAFYERNGAIPTGVKCLLLSVDYEILVILPESFEEENGDAAQNSFQAQDYLGMLDKLYKKLYTPIFGKFCKLYIKE